MRAIVLSGFGGLESLVIKELPDPEPKVGHVLIAVKAFGVNQAETHMRKGDWAEAAEVSGIECVGRVVAAPGGEFQAGDKVAAFMGGMGRTINGSYAELTLVPATNVVKITTDLSWEEFAVVPESYATAWTCLYGNLQVEKGQILLLRGATSALGQAALNIASNAALNVIATTRNPARFEKLLELGARRVELEGPGLSKRLPEGKKVDVVLDLVGNSTLLDSIAIPHRHGRICPAGWLDSNPSRSSTRCCRWQASFTSALCLIRRSFLCWKFVSERSWAASAKAYTRRNRQPYFLSMRFVRPSG